MPEKQDSVTICPMQAMDRNAVSDIDNRVADDFLS
jgi:hypothetical protein